MANNGNLTPWKPGQSGNSKGRPKKVDLKAILEEVLAGTRVCGKEVLDADSVARAFVESQVMHAINGDPSISKQIWERMSGKVPSKLDSETVSKIVVEYVDEPLETEETSSGPEEDSG